MIMRIVLLKMIRNKKKNYISKIMKFRKKIQMINKIPKLKILINN